MHASSEDDWKAAESIARRVYIGLVEKRRDTLPYMFTGKLALRAKTFRAVLVHNGEVVEERGPAIAGAYLRDLGVLEGRGPNVDDMLWALWGLEALPPIDEAHEEAYVNDPSPRLAELTARWSAPNLVLHYFTQDTVRGGGSRSGPLQRSLIRMTLTIPTSGDAAWSRENIVWTDPET